MNLKKFGISMLASATFKAGRVYKLRHWKYAGWRYQR